MMFVLNAAVFKVIRLRQNRMRRRIEMMFIEMARRSRLSDEEARELSANVEATKKKMYSFCQKQLSPINFSYIETEAESCRICLLDFESEDQIQMTDQCFHLFHIQCIEEWIR
jgi:hypothetical protein